MHANNLIVPSMLNQQICLRKRPVRSRKRLYGRSVQRKSLEVTVHPPFSKSVLNPIGTYIENLGWHTRVVQYTATSWLQKSLQKGENLLSLPAGQWIRIVGILLVGAMLSQSDVRRKRLLYEILEVHMQKLSVTVQITLSTLQLCYDLL